MTGPNLRAKIIVEATRNTIDDMELDGGVTVTRDHVTGTSPEPLTITGERLKLNTSENGMADVQMVGSPAKVKVGSGSLEGPEVRFNQRDQRVWIDHPGNLSCPSSRLRSHRIGAKEFNGRVHREFAGLEE